MTELLDRFVAGCERNGLIVHVGRVPEIEDAVVSRAAYGLADPGSVVLFASPAEPRGRSILPEIHVAVLDEGDILPDLPALLRAVNGSLPSSLVIVSGPSRTGDIEMTLQIGVHGPREQHVAVIRGGGR